MEERKFIISENKLIYFLIAEMEMIANQRDGIDSWQWYGCSRNEVLNDYFPGPLPENEDLDFCQVAMARIDAGEFVEM